MAFSLPPNTLKHRLAAGERLPGFWLSLGNSSIAEIASEAGFDWVLIDMEHGDNTVADVANQLRAVMRGGAEPVVRISSLDPALVKRLLDSGVRSLMFPNIKSVDEARLAVAATRYPPHGVRGVAGTSRGAGYGRLPAYFQTAADDICVIVQLETAASVAIAAEIAAVEGVDVLFIGPSDLSADMGHIGDQAHEAVQALIASVAGVIAASGKVPAILDFDAARADTHFANGYRMVAVAGDANVLARETTALVGRFKRVKPG